MFSDGSGWICCCESAEEGRPPGEPSAIDESGRITWSSKKLNGHV